MHLTGRPLAYILHLPLGPQGPRGQLGACVAPQSCLGTPWGSFEKRSQMNDFVPFWNPFSFLTSIPTWRRLGWRVPSPTQMAFEGSGG